ncbi:MAG TPA: ABC transporter permease [Candidatus Elarobacter sp.]
MNTVAIVFAAEFERRVRSRAFVFGTVIGAVSIALIAFLPAMVGNFAGASKTLVLVGEPRLTSTAAQLLARDFTIAASVPRLPQSPKDYLDAHKKVTAVAVLARARDGLRVETYTRNPGELRGTLATDLVPLQVGLTTGVQPETIAAHTRVTIDEHDVSGRFSNATQAIEAKGIAYVFVMLLYLAILLNAQSIVGAVAEEKTSRIAELLVASIDTAQLLLAKVLAATASGFIQLALWIGTAALAARAVGDFFNDNAPAASASAGVGLGVTPTEVLWFVLFFVLGFIQYAVLFAAAGSLVNRSEDTSSISGPLYIPIVGAIVIAQFALQYPNAPNAVVLSFVPLLSPFVMFTRVVVSTVPVWQLVTSIALNVVTAVALAWAAGRVYRLGMLLYGRVPTPRQIVAALRQR